MVLQHFKPVRVEPEGKKQEGKRGGVQGMRCDNAAYMAGNERQQQARNNRWNRNAAQEPNGVK